MGSETGTINVVWQETWKCVNEAFVEINRSPLLWKTYFLFISLVFVHGKCRKTAINSYTFPPNLYNFIIYINYIYTCKLCNIMQLVQIGNKIHCHCHMSPSWYSGYIRNVKSTFSWLVIKSPKRFHHIIYLWLTWLHKMNIVMFIL